MIHSLRARLVTVLIAALGPAAAAQTTWVVDDNGTGDFVHIQDAVNAAQDGDVISVLDGAYAGFTIDAKSLVVAGDPAGDVRVAAHIVVRNVAVGQRVELDGLRLGQPFTIATAPTVVLEDNPGSVRIVDCEVYGRCSDPFCDYAAFEALESSFSDDVGVLRSTFQGASGYYGYDPRPGISTWTSQLLITDSVVTGAGGLSAPFGCTFGLPGGPGLYASSSNVVCSGSSFMGGPGGFGDCSPPCYFYPCHDGSDGIAVDLTPDSTCRWKASTFNGVPGPETGPFERTEFAAFCFGTYEECPCGNNGAAGAGCNTSYDSGGVELSAAGNPSVAFDTVTLSATGFRPTGSPSGLFFQGTTQVGGGLGALFNDGLLCASGTILRLKGKIAVNGAISFGFGNPNDPLVSVKGAIPPAGGTRYYQVWYRNQAPLFCTTERFNMSNGLEITWLP